MMLLMNHFCGLRTVEKKELGQKCFYRMKAELIKNYKW